MKKTKPVAVHFNFAAQKLSVRHIHPATGVLTKLIRLADRAILSGAFFNVNTDKLRRWREGGDQSKHARQFAHVQGREIKRLPAGSGPGIKVIFNPRQMDSFCREDGTPVREARYAVIKGREMRAFL